MEPLSASSRFRCKYSFLFVICTDFSEFQNSWQTRIMKSNVYSNGVFKNREQRWETVTKKISLHSVELLDRDEYCMSTRRNLKVGETKDPLNENRLNKNI